ncbi:mucin-2-like [Physella acuta]|uniref:mucin-2-like n=1 Tax=Physella acuta TaxID=109671 RepID=UPI0027DCFD13|nr:mucin-2-like [Physella acuta]XP_059142095.1 mucin-2-like [Physella acuta]
MSASLSYPFQPQPPPHPKTTGGKKGPSTPIAIPYLQSEDDESDESITDHSPPVTSSLPSLDTATTRANNVFILTTKTSPRTHPNGKKSNVSLPSPRTQNNSSGTITLNHIVTALNQSHSSSGTPVLIITNGTNSTSANSTTTSATSLNTNTTSQNLTNAVAISSNSCNTNTTLAPQINNPSNTVSTPTARSTDQNDGSSFAQSISSSSPREGPCSPFSNFAYEHDHDYENIASPSSSTSSGPIYIRPPGFKHHAQEIVSSNVKSLKKKKCSTHVIKEGFKKREATPPRLKPKRDPLPMKLRALPQSFWQQPNVAHQVSPATLFPILPPLTNKESDDGLMEIRPVTPPEKSHQTPERKLTVANTDLLFKLFEGIGEEKKLHTKVRTAQKVRKLVSKSNTKGLLLGNDPFMVEAVTEKIFPQLNLEGPRHSGGGNSSIQLITFKEGDRTVTLPSLSIDQNYPQMLSELVAHI